MNRARSLLFGGGALVLLGVGWWLFGWNTYRVGEDHITLHRRFGRVTRLDSFVVANGVRTRERALFAWSQPFVNGNSGTDCGAIFPERWQDRNGDGRWDTWLYRVGPDATGHCQVQYRVDTKNVGRPDWIFDLPYGQYAKADTMMKKRRGF